MQDRNIWKMLFETTESIRNYRERMGTPCDRPELSLSQIRVLGCVFFSPDGKVKIKEIAEELAITSGAVSQSVEKLVQIGMVDRRQDPDDRRAVAVMLLEKGRMVREKLDAEFDALVRPLLRGVPPEKLEIFTEVLMTMLQSIQNEKKKRRLLK